MKNVLSKNRRSTQINEVINDLVQIRGNSLDSYKYAIDENISFFESSRSFFSYYIWLVARARKIIGNQLLEINDLLPKWDREMHQQLIALEKRKFPGLVQPLVSEICKILTTSNERQIIVNLGHGGMEVERQILNKLIKTNNSTPFFFVGIDKSETSRAIAKENLNEMAEFIEIIETKNLDNNKLDNIIKNANKRYTVILSDNNIFDLENNFHTKSFNIIFHSLFKHHIISKAEKDKLDSICINLAHTVFEFDGCKNWFLMLFPHTLTAWANPIFLNASIFSDLRYYKKSDLIKEKKGKSIKFFPIGTYLRKY